MTAAAALPVPSKRHRRDEVCLSISPVVSESGSGVRLLRVGSFG